MYKTYKNLKKKNFLINQGKNQKYGQTFNISIQDICI